MIELKELNVTHGNVPLRYARGHFATNHSHINYYIDITYEKTRLSAAKDSAHQLVSHFINNTPVDTILCLDGTAVLGACVADELTHTGDFERGFLDDIRNFGQIAVRTLGQSGTNRTRAGYADIDFTVGFTDTGNRRLCCAHHRRNGY